MTQKQTKLIRLRIKYLVSNGINEKEARQSVYDVILHAGAESLERYFKILDLKFGEG